MCLGHPLEEELLRRMPRMLKIDGDYLRLARVSVPCLLFADLVMLSSTTAGLQAMLETLERFSRRTGLTVNRSKTKVVVFGTRFQKARAERA
jgi:site-specific recombinase